jgi:hypothetical protein
MDTLALQDALAALLRGEVEDIEEGLTEALAGTQVDDVWADGVTEILSRVLTFEEDGVLTSDPGLVLRMSDGSEFQLTLVRSR